MTEEDREWRSSPIYQIFELFGRTWATPEEYDFLDRVLEAHAQKKVKEFAEFCHEHHKGCMLNAKDEYVYQYDSDIVSLVEEYLKSKHKSK